MCGIVGFVGQGVKVEDILSGLRKLEYRGYDSAGVAYNNDSKIEVFKKEGRIMNLEGILEGKNELSIKNGIGHTRWATHGGVCDENSHPHLDSKGKFAVVHNGIIENFQELKEALIKKGHVFISQTDTEVIPHLFEEYFDGDLLSTLFKVVKMLQGTYAVAVMYYKDTNTLVAARKGSPLCVAHGENVSVIASDITPMLKFSRDVIFMNDGEVVRVTPEKVDLYDLDGHDIKRKPVHIDWNEEAAEKGGYPYFMEKEIFNQPTSIKAALAGRVKDGEPTIKELEPIKDFIENKLNKVYIVACGTAYHAGLSLKYFLNNYSNISCDIEVASEFRYMNPNVDSNSLVIAVSQSGETIDTLEGLRMAKSKGAHVLAVSNVVGSTIPRESNSVVYMQTGPEIGVAASKTYTAQVSILYTIGAQILKWKGMFNDDIKHIMREIENLPEYFEKVLDSNECIKELAREYTKYKHMMYIGRKFGFVTALEGALKLKEISYIHASGYQAGELKHGPIALLDEAFPVLAIVPSDEMREKMISNIMEVKARRARVIAIATEGDDKIREIANEYIFVPKCHEAVYPLVMAPVIQLFAYHVAVLRDLDPDKPRNLAKSVTVE